MSVIIILLCILVVLIILVIVSTKCKDSFGNITEKITGMKNFKTPNSFTKLKAVKTNIITTVNKSGKNLLEKYAKQLKSISDVTTRVDDVNILQTPSFFNSNEKWPGCLPRPLFQGTCGSCWGFASVTALSSRFYIESCGNSGCDNYPQINTGSLDDVMKNINYEYGFRKDYLSNMTDKINTIKGNYITKDEWMKSAEKFQKELMNKSKSMHERHMVAQILVYMLDFQSLGSVDIKNLKIVKDRALKTFDIWRRGFKKINLESLQKLWRNQPLNLSAEKLIACCTNCMKLEFTASKDAKITNNPVCGGGSLIDAWVLLRDTGTSTSLCIGYNLDNYSEGDKLSSCKEIQGPYYSFCSGYKLDEYKNVDKKVTELEKSKVYPLAIPNEAEVPWIDPQLFRFRAKNAYTIDNNMAAIQQEIIERGPVNSGFLVYNDYQTSYGDKGLGGQKYKVGTNPLGSDSSSLIYMKDPETKEQPVGGHAITIVGWGTYRHVVNKVEYYIPYWTCLNSWGVEWGHSGFPAYGDRNREPEDMKGGGYFWIVRGINNCGIEENITCGQPNIENMTYPGIIGRYGWGTSPPSTDNKNVHFLPLIDTGDKKLNESSRLEILPAEEGGGTYVDYIPGCTEEDSGVWQIKSMKAPSPFLMFWPKNRPVYCIGTLKNDINKFDKKLVVSGKTIEYIQLLQKVVKNPLLLIGESGENEQIQVINVDCKALYITVNRAVNFNNRLKHKKSTKLKVFPYNNLDDAYLKDNGFYECNVLN
jgi:hypothetical protein